MCSPCSIDVVADVDDRGDVGRGDDLDEPARGAGPRRRRRRATVISGVSEVGASLPVEQVEVGVDHHRARARRSVVFGFQPSIVAGLRRVADEQVDLGGRKKRLVDDDVLLPVEADVAEGELAELADRVGLAGGDHVVVGLVLLQHQPHGLDVVAGEAPVALGVEVAEPQLVGQAELDAGDARG